MGNAHYVGGNGRIQRFWKLVGLYVGDVDGMRYRVKVRMGKRMEWEDAQLQALKSVGQISGECCYRGRLYTTRQDQKEKYSQQHNMHTDTLCVEQEQATEKR
jgi:hypothetical protein